MDGAIIKCGSCGDIFSCSNICGDGDHLDCECNEPNPWVKGFYTAVQR